MRPLEEIAASDLAGKAVWVGKDHIPGVIGIRPVHLAHGENYQKPVDVDDLHIDVGPVAGKEKVGDRATFATSFMRLGPSLCGKALDNRLGVCTLIELVKHAPPNIDLQAAFTVQEEIATRGARVAAYTLILTSPLFWIQPPRMICQPGIATKMTVTTRTWVPDRRFM